jgi:protein kinase A
MKMFDHSFFTALYATFQDERCLYLVQQYVPGGDMWGVIHLDSDSVGLEKTRIGGLEPDVASFYAANVLVVLEHLHQRDTVFRDLKPENFGVDTSGYLRVYDFGAAKVMVGEETSNTMVGTPEYLSPEMITSKGHARGVDIWSFGVFLYEMLTGKTPFEHANSAMIYQHIMDSDEVLRLAFTKSFDPDARDLIHRLLVPNPHMRLGMLRDGLADLWAHPFLTRGGKSERQVSMKNIPAPFKPKDLDRGHMDLNDLMIGSWDSDVIPDYAGSFDFSKF